MVDIGIVGAGAAAAAATFVLDGAVENAEIEVIEKSGGVGGRAATRRRGDVTYDYGANYVKSNDERVVGLLTETLSTQGLVDVTEPIYTFDEAGDVSEGRDADERKWTYESGLTQIAKRLFGRTDAAVRRDTRVETIEREGERWRLRDANGGEWGPYEELLLTPPAPQAADLLREAEWESDLREALLAEVEDVGYRTIWTALLHYPFEVDRPYYALVNTDKAHEVGWIAREECKRGHVPEGESLLVVQANHEWSVEHYDDPAAENVAALATLTANLVGDDRLTDPDWTDHQGWRYALPETGACEGVLREAEAEGLHFLGDWVAGEGRLHAALRSGLEAGEKIGDDRVSV